MGLMSWLRDGGSRLRGGARAEDDGRTEKGGAGTDHDVRADHGHDVRAEHGVPRERADLSELPPIQRTLTGQSLITNPSGFQETLSTRRDVALGTPLGHLVDPDAPTGLVHGVTAPAPAEHGGDSVQRSARAPEEVRGGLSVRGRPLPVAPSASVGATTPGLVGVQRATGAGPAAMTSAGESAAAELPVRRLVGERAVAALPDGPGAAPVSASDGVPVPPPVQRAAMPPAGERARRAPGLGAPLQALPPTAQRRAVATDAGTEPGTGTRTGTGADGGAVLPVVPTGPVVSVARSAENGDGSGATAGAPGPSDASVRRETSGPEAPTAPLLGDDPLLAVPVEPAPATGGSVQRRTDPLVRRTDPLVPAPLSPLPASGPVAPLLADRPLTPPSVHGSSIGGGAPPAAVQRLGPADGPAGTGHGPGSGTGSGTTPGSGTGGDPDAVPVRWTSEGTRSPGDPWVATVSLSDAVPVQRGSTPSPNAPGSASGARSRPLPGVQRQSVGGPPVPRSAGGAGSRAAPVSSLSADGFTTAGAVAVAAGVAQRMADGSVVFGPPASTYTSSAYTPPAYSAPVVQRETESEEPPLPEPAPEPGPAPDPEPEPEPAPEPAGTTAGDPAPPGPHPPAPGGAPPVVTDELVRALYPPLSRLLKADLRLERERAGFLINTRH
ncbi:hypothetical protein ACF1A9_21610 [Streptomyces sp. NPDC014872]|uniref:hypothetical protein n=1 Tax=Streptomyces sp. NPDC014872 TaxID=3364926 RepID=UPI0036FAF29D